MRLGKCCGNRRGKKKEHFRYSDIFFFDVKMTSFKKGELAIAQLGERWIVAPSVTGSNPVSETCLFFCLSHGLDKQEWSFFFLLNSLP